VKAEEILTLDQAAALLKVTAKTVRAMCRRGELPGARKAGREWRITMAAIDAFFAPVAGALAHRDERQEDDEAPTAEPPPGPDEDRGRPAQARIRQRDIPRTGEDILDQLRAAGRSPRGAVRPKPTPRGESILHMLPKAPTSRASSRGAAKVRH
jgi:excisionase family DNA binding protein